MNFNNLSKKRKIQFSCLAVYSIISIIFVILGIIGLVWLTSKYKEGYDLLSSKKIDSDDAVNIQNFTWSYVKANLSAADINGLDSKSIVNLLDPVIGSFKVSAKYSAYMWFNGIGFTMLVPMVVGCIVAILLKYKPTLDPEVKAVKKANKIKVKHEKYLAKNNNKNIEKKIKINLAKVGE